MTTTTTHDLSSIVVLGVVPAVAMLLCTVLGLGVRVPKNVAGALQHFAAGVLLSAIGTELLPPLTKAKGWSENIGLTVGFVCGMGLLIVLGILLPEEDDEEEEDEDDGASETQQKSTTVVGSTVIKRESRLHHGYSYSERVSAKMTNPTNVPASATESQPLLLSADPKGDRPSSSSSSSATSDNNNNNKVGSFPTQFLIAIVVDSFMDGLLIGIAAAAGPSAGPMMAASLSVEMAFLGLTLATALHGMAWSKSLPAALAGPVTIVAGATCGGLLSGALRTNPTLFAGLMGFGTSALLFMVAEELLLEAHEDGNGHIWWVDLQLYVGFYVSFMSSKFMGE